MKTETQTTMKLLQEGDIIELTPGKTVYFDVPMHFVDPTEMGNFKETIQFEVIIGRPFGIEGLSMETGFLVGKYIVTRTETSIGSQGHGEVYPDGHHVTCNKITSPENRHDITVRFYQTGIFTAKIRPNEIQAIGRAENKWIVPEVHQ